MFFLHNNAIGLVFFFFWIPKDLLSIFWDRPKSLFGRFLTIWTQSIQLASPIPFTLIFKDNHSLIPTTILLSIPANTMSLTYKEMITNSYQIVWHTHNGLLQASYLIPNFTNRCIRIYLSLSYNSKHFHSSYLLENLFQETQNCWT